MKGSELVLAVLTSVAMVACGTAGPSPTPPPDVPVASECPDGETRPCTCPGGERSFQLCRGDGTGYGVCLTCSSPPDDVPSVPDRVQPPPDGPSDACAAATSCATCTPLPGCGWCGVTRRCMPVNATCRGPATGACGSGWACQPTDCSDSTDCRPCTADADCISGTCGVRACDGAMACVPLGRPANCLTVGGEACPAVAAYRRCAATTDCGSRMHCVPVWPGQSERVCTPVCNVSGDCPQPTATGGVGTAVCLSTGARACALVCMREGTCDTGSTCRRDLTGNYAFCL